MVLDSANDLDIIFTKSSKYAKQDVRPQMSRFLPRSSLGTVIITRRDKRVAKRLADRQAPIQVLPMSGVEAQDLLSSKLPEELVLDAMEVAELQETALRAISAHFPLGDYENWRQSAALSPHVRTYESPPQPSAVQ